MHHLYGSNVFLAMAGYRESNVRDGLRGVHCMRMPVRAETVRFSRVRELLIPDEEIRQRK